MIPNAGVRAMKLRSAARAAGLIVISLAVLLAGYDAARSLVDRLLRVTKVGDVWFAIHRESLLLLQPAIERHIEPLIGGWLWDPVMLKILTAPTWLVLGVIGAILVLFGRKKKPLIRYSRR
jgi:hypothetical protein